MHFLPADFIYSGLRIAQVRVIFQLPSHYPVKLSQPLAYIEWFTPFRTPNKLDGYYHVSRSTRKIAGKDGPYSDVVPVARIVRNPMIIPEKWGHDSKFLETRTLMDTLFVCFNWTYETAFQCKVVL
jgi:hypothetical protein